MASRTGVGREAELRVCNARIDEWRRKRIAACGQSSEQTEIAPALTGSAATPSGKSLKFALPHSADRRGGKGVRTLFGVFRVGGGLTGGSGAGRLPAPNSHLQRASPD